MYKLAIFTLVTLWAMGAANAADSPSSNAARVSSALSKKLPGRQRSVKSQRDLQPVDSLITCPQLDSIIVLREQTLSAISMLPPHAATIVAKHPQFSGRELSAIIWTNEAVFVLNEQAGTASKGRPAIVFAPRSKRLFSVQPPNFQLIEGSRFDTTIVALSPDRTTAVFRLSYAGPTKGVPNDRNSPWYCWVNVATGSISHVPYQWDPLFVTADSTGVIFQGKYVENSFKSPTRHLLKLADGKWSDEIPDLEEVPVFEFDWTNTSTTRGLVRRVATGDTYFVQGMASAGKVFFPLEFPARLEYPKEAQITGGFGAIHVRKSEERDYDESLWMVPVANKGEARRLTIHVKSFALLSNGKCVFASVGTRGNDGNQVRESATYYDYSSKQSLNLWEDFPVLNPVASKTVQDSRRTSVVTCFGSERYSDSAFLRLRHDQLDLNSAPLQFGSRMDLSKLVPLDKSKASSAPLAVQVGLGTPRHGATRIRDYFVAAGRRDSISLPDSCRDSTFIAHKSGTLVAQKEQWDPKGRRTLLLTIYDFD